MLPATLGTLAVAAALVAAVLVSLIPAHGFGPLLPVGRVLKEHARHRHHETPERNVMGPDTAQDQPDPAGEVRRRQGSHHQPSRHQGSRSPGPRPPSLGPPNSRSPGWRSPAKRPRRHPHNPLHDGLHHLQCDLFHHPC